MTTLTIPYIRLLLWYVTVTAVGVIYNPDLSFSQQC